MNTVMKEVIDAVLEHTGELEGSSGSVDATELAPDLYSEDEDTHPWDGWTYGYDLETICTHAQTRIDPAEYAQRGTVWVDDPDGTTVWEENARAWN